MTWAKFGVEFRCQLLMADLSDAAARTHFEALMWLYEIESGDVRIPRRLVRNVCGSAAPETGARELVAAGFWREDGDAYVVEHHADVYRASLAAQLLHRETEKDRQRRKRRSDVGTNVGANVRATQTDKQTASHPVPSTDVSSNGQRQYIQECNNCSQPFTALRASARYCSDRCRQKAHRDRKIEADRRRP